MPISVAAEVRGTTLENTESMVNWRAVAAEVPIAQYTREHRVHGELENGRLFQL